MSDKRKIAETLQSARDAVNKAHEALSQAMEELNLDDLEDISGAGNPLGNLPRVPTQPIDDGLRNNG